MSDDVQNEISPFRLLLNYVELSTERRETRVSRGDYTDGYLAFSVGEDCYLIGMTQVLEVATDVGTITPLPFSPKWLLGLISHRSEVYSVVDFARFLGKKSRTSGRAQNHNFILLRDVGQGYVLKVDTVYGIRTCEIGLLQSQYGWVDGHAHMEEKDWMRINLANLVADTAFVQSIQ